MKNKLIQYKGGGYDGCFWEWNYCYYDKDGKWHDIWRSGRCGCATQQEFIDDFINADSSEQDDDYFIYELTQDGLAEFIAETSKDHLLAVVNYLNGEDYEFALPCTVCEGLSGPESMTLENARGAGGVMIQHDALICEHCWSMYACSWCGEYYGADYANFDDEDRCEYCQVTFVEDKIKEHERVLKNLEFGNWEQVRAIEKMEILKTELKVLRSKL